MNKLLKSLVGLVDDDSLCLAIHSEGCQSVENILALQDNDIDGLEYDKSSGDRPSVPAFHHNLFKALRAWNYYLTVTLGVKKVDWDDPALIGQNEFYVFRATIYDPDTPIRQLPRSSTAKPVHGRVLLSPILNPSGKHFNSAQDFCKGNKRDKAHYAVLKDKKVWDDWKRGVESTATTHTCENVLDPVYDPNTVDDVALSDEQ